MLSILINWALNAFVLLMLIRCVLSWFRPSHYHSLVRLVEDVTEPILRPIRQILPPWKTAGLDFSPAIAVLLAWLLAQILIGMMR